MSMVNYLIVDSIFVLFYCSNYNKWIIRIHNHTYTINVTANIINVIANDHKQVINNLIIINT